ncbi:hypothetical protein LTR10_009822 [Elasticomyces elasticus]|uniref:HCNGP-domain-containing protein n=1 Tax=Elasticomyces elasticus TaxID=574655 RepID=A0AAN7ZWV2_9PEZI|nr:hypothetical protein LTR10_009822 [Elasticomyces elasticus]KAK4970111.1 hypothetical protein LTR42_008278 [Elasticomyces elasticus]KAK5693557.1 hypothetical protein LTR97_010126 [Elasticomyces elasticus]
MSALVAYASSDEEDDVQPEKPAKSFTDAQVARIVKEGLSAQQPSKRSHASIAEPETHIQPLGPAQGPSAPAQDMSDTPSDPPASPYTSERLRVRELTMPPFPNFEIPDAPPLPQMNSEEAAALAATTKKFERFLELKKQGVHFNERLQNSSSLRNPSLLPKLMEFASISLEDSYASTISESEGGVPVKWAEECYVENLVKQNEKREKKRVAEREKVDFVPAQAKSRASSAAGTPASGATGRKSRFDKR